MGTTESDPLSIMCYEIPAAITKDGKVIRGGEDINRKDLAFAAAVYPRRARRRRQARGAASAALHPRRPSGSASTRALAPNQRRCCMTALPPGTREPGAEPAPEEEAAASHVASTPVLAATRRLEPQK